VVASILVSLSLLPTALSTTSAPPISTPERMPFRELTKEVPTGVTTMLFVGMAAGTLLGMGAVFGARVAMEPSEIAVFMGAPIAGAVLFQWPVGAASDRFPRRGLMVVLALSAIAAALAMTAVDKTSLAGTGLMFILGGAMFPLYSLTIAYTADWIPPSKMASASSSLVMVNGAGAVLGPLITALAFVAFGTGAFFPVLAVSHALIAVYLGYRIMVRDALPVHRQRPWVPISSRATAAITVLARPRRARRD